MARPQINPDDPKRSKNFSLRSSVIETLNKTENASKTIEDLVEDNILNRTKLKKRLVRKLQDLQEDFKKINCELNVEEIKDLQPKQLEGSSKPEEVDILREIKPTKKKNVKKKM